MVPPFFATGAVLPGLLLDNGSQPARHTQTALTVVSARSSGGDFGAAGSSLSTCGDSLAEHNQRLLVSILANALSGSLYGTRERIPNEHGSLEPCQLLPHEDGRPAVVRAPDA